MLNMSTHTAVQIDYDWTVTRTADALARGQGTTLTQLGEQVGIKKATMSRRVHEGGWKLTEVTKMAEALGYEPNDLITGLGGTLRLDGSRRPTPGEVGVQPNDQVTPLRRIRRDPDYYPYLDAMSQKAA